MLLLELLTLTLAARSYALLYEAIEPLYSCFYYINPPPQPILAAYGLGMRLVIWGLLQILLCLVVSCVLGVKLKVPRS